MRRILFIVLILISGLKAQEIGCKNSAQKAWMEHENALVRLSNKKATNASSNFNIHYTKFIFKVNPVVRYLEAEVAIRFKTNISTDSIVLDLSFQLIVDSILYNGYKINFLQRANNSLVVYFNVALVANDDNGITIFYKGEPGSSGYGSFIQDTHNNIPIIWTLSEPYGSKDWFPCKNGLNDKIDSIDVYIVHPSFYNATSNGVLQSKQTNTNQSISFFKHRYPIASYLIAIAVTNYTVQQINIPLGNYSLPYVTTLYPESVEEFSKLLIPTINALQLFSKSFGVYPFYKEQYGITQFGWGGGMEHQTNSFLSAPDTNVMAHELAHQWFGNKLTCNSWQHIWLNEGFATFAANYFFEKTDTSKFSKLLLTQLNNITSLPDGSVFVTDTTDIGRVFSSRLSYDKAAYVLRMLRFTVGDSVFFEAINNYLNDTQLQYSFVTTNNFIQHIEAVAKQDLSWFFNQWIYGEGFPTYNITWSKNNYHWVKIKVNQTTSHFSVPFYRTALPLTFKNKEKQKTIVLQCNTNNQFFWAYLGFDADTVLIDKDAQLISKNNTATQLLANTISVNDVVFYPNPIKDNLFIKFLEPIAQEVYINLFNSLGQKLYSTAFKQITESTILKIPFSSYLPGLYFINLIAENGKQFFKILIK